ncbi:hypothetical protein CF392_00895, partial [Tamilnaduibacter salinus]
MDDQKLEQEIKGCAEYLKEKQSQDAEFEGSSLLPGEALSLRDETKLKLEESLRKAEALEKNLLPLVLSVRDIPFDGIERHVNQAFKAASNAVVECRLALLESVPRPPTKKKRYHKSAALLAVAISPGEEARRIATRIIQKANLDDDYSERSMTNWLKEARETLYGDGKLASPRY